MVVITMENGKQIKITRRHMCICQQIFHHIQHRLGMRQRSVLLIGTENMTVLHKRGGSGDCGCINSLYFHSLTFVIVIVLAFSSSGCLRISRR